MAGQHAGHHLDWPLLQRLGHHGVVGVVQALRGQLPCLVPRHVHHINQQAHELRHSNGRVGVVHLHCHLLWQFRPLVVGTLDELAQQILQRSTHEEVLLPQAELPALVACVVRVEDGRQVLCLSTRLHGIGEVRRTVLVQIELLGGASTPQSEIVSVVSVEARNGIVVCHGLDDVTTNPVQAPLTLGIEALLNFAVKPHWVGDVRPRNLEGASIPDPEIRHLHLTAVLNVLFEHAIAVSDAITPARQRQSCHGVEEACGKTAQATVAQRWVHLFVEKVLQLHAECVKGFLEGLLQIEVRNGILHVSSDQVFGRQVVSPLHIHLPVVGVGVVQRLQQTIPEHQTSCPVGILHGEVEACAGQGVLQMPGKRLLDGLWVVRLVRLHQLPKLLHLFLLVGILVCTVHGPLDVVQQRKGRLALHVNAMLLGIPHAGGGHDHRERS